MTVPQITLRRSAYANKGLSRAESCDFGFIKMRRMDSDKVIVEYAVVAHERYGRCPVFLLAFSQFPSLLTKMHVQRQLQALSKVRPFANPIESLPM